MNFQITQSKEGKSVSSILGKRSSKASKQLVAAELGGESKKDYINQSSDLNSQKAKEQQKEQLRQQSNRAQPQTYHNFGNSAKDPSGNVEATEYMGEPTEINQSYDASSSTLSVRLTVQGGNQPEANQSYTKALEINPNDNHGYLSQGISLGDQGRNIEAIECQRKAFEINPNSVNSQNLEKKQPNYSQAIEFVKAIEINPKQSNTQASTKKLQLYLQSSQIIFQKNIQKLKSQIQEITCFTINLIIVFKFLKCGRNTQIFQSLTSYQNTSTVLQTSKNVEVVKKIAGQKMNCYNNHLQEMLEKSQVINSEDIEDISNQSRQDNSNNGNILKMIGSKNYIIFVRILKKVEEILKIHYELESQTYQRIFLQYCLRYLFESLIQLSSFDELDLIEILQKLATYLKQAAQKAFNKFEFSTEMKILYKRLDEQPKKLPFFKLHQLFKPFFLKESYILLSINVQIWRKMARIVFQQNNRSKEEVQNLINALKADHQIFLQEQHKRGEEQLEKLVSNFKEQQSKAVLFLQKEPSKQQRKKQLAFQNGIAKLKQLPNIQNLMTLEANLDLITLVQQCQTYESPFLHFLVPFTYLLAQSLAYYDQKSSKNLAISNLFSLLIKKINLLKNSKNSELAQKQLMDHIVIFVNYPKYAPQQLCEMMGKFLVQHGDKMKGFIPVYYDIFCFYAFEKYQFIRQLEKITGIKEKRRLLLARIEKMYQDCQKYHNPRIL